MAVDRRARGHAVEVAARDLLRRAGLTDIAANANYRGGELDLVMQDASRPGTIRNGDLLLWGSRTVVVFYRTFESSYAYTRLGRVDDPTGLFQSLGRHDVRVVFSRN